MNKEICFISSPGNGLSCCCCQSEVRSPSPTLPGKWNEAADPNLNPMQAVETESIGNSHREHGEYRREGKVGRGWGRAVQRARTQSVRNAQIKEGGALRGRNGVGTCGRRLAAPCTPRASTLLPRAPRSPHPPRSVRVSARAVTPFCSTTLPRARHRLVPPS